MKNLIFVITAVICSLENTEKAINEDQQLTRHQFQMFLLLLSFDFICFSREPNRHKIAVGQIYK